MADIIHPEGTYKIAQVGPSRPWEFNSNGETVQMVGYSVQFEGIADWVDVNVKADGAAPKPGDALEGHIEQSKFGYKFTKKRGGGGRFGGGGGGYSKGAQWANAYQTAAIVLQGYFVASGSKPKGIEDFLDKLDDVADSIRKSIDAKLGETQATTPSTPTPPATAPDPTAPAGMEQPPAFLAPQGDAEVKLADITTADLKKGW